MPVIPWPVHYLPAEGQFYVPDAVVISYSGAGIAKTAQLLERHLQQRLHLSPAVAPAEELGQSASILLVCESEPISELAVLPNNKEAYELEVLEAHIRVRAHDPHGVFHGVQTLIQLLPPFHTDAGVSVDCLRVRAYADIPEKLLLECLPLILTSTSFWRHKLDHALVRTLPMQR